MTAPKSWKCLSLPGGCACQCHAIVDGKKRNPQRRSLWTPQRDDELRRLTSLGWTQRAIAGHLHISITSVRHRRQELGISTRDGWRSEYEVGQALGVSWRYTRRWRSQGLLVADSHEGSSWWRISDAALKMFVREQAGTIVVVGRIKDPELRRIAEVASIANLRGVEAAG